MITVGAIVLVRVRDEDLERALASHLVWLVRARSAASRSPRGASSYVRSSAAPAGAGNEHTRLRRGRSSERRSRHVASANKSLSDRGWAFTSSASSTIAPRIAGVIFRRSAARSSEGPADLVGGVSPGQDRRRLHRAASLGPSRASPRKLRNLADTTATVYLVADFFKLPLMTQAEMTWSGRPASRSSAFTGRPSMASTPGSSVARTSSSDP